MGNEKMEKKEVIIPDSSPVMRQLPGQFRKNELPYTLIKRNEVVALYGVGGTYTDKILHHEVCEIHYHQEREVFGRILEAGEALASDEKFGKDGSRAIVNREEALIYFDELTIRLKMSHVPPKGDTIDDKTSQRYQSATSQIDTPISGKVRDIN
jgi:hypothetical protein